MQAKVTHDFEHILAGRGNAFGLERIDDLLCPETLLAFGEDTFNGFHKLAFALHVPDFTRTDFSALCVVVVGSTFDFKGIAESVDREVARIVKCVDDGEPLGQRCLRSAWCERENLVDGLLVFQRLRNKIEVARRVFCRQA